MPTFLTAKFSVTVAFAITTTNNTNKVMNMTKFRRTFEKPVRPFRGEGRPFIDARVFSFDASVCLRK